MGTKRLHRQIASTQTIQLIINMGQPTPQKDPVATQHVLFHFICVHHIIAFLFVLLFYRLSSCMVYVLITFVILWGCACQPCGSLCYTHMPHGHLSFGPDHAKLVTSAKMDLYTNPWFRKKTANLYKNQLFLKKIANLHKNKGFRKKTMILYTNPLVRQKTAHKSPLSRKKDSEFLQQSQISQKDIDFI